MLVKLMLFTMAFSLDSCSTLNHHLRGNVMFNRKVRYKMQETENITRCIA